MPQLWNGKLLLFSRDNAEKTKGAFANSYMYEHNFSSARWMLNEKCFLLMLRCRQRCLGSLCLAVFIYCQAEVDLQFSLYQILSQHPQSRRTREKPDWRGAWEENQHIWVWLKPSKRSPSARPFFFSSLFCHSAYSADEQHMEKDILYFCRHVLFVFLWNLRFRGAPAKWSESLQQLPGGV